MRYRLLSALIAGIFMLTLTVTTAHAATKRIMVYGDSNAFGWVKDTKGVVGRFPPDVRWPEHMGTLLGNDYEIIVEALGGRTTNLDCPVQSGPGLIPGAGMNGATYLPAALGSHMPLDMVIIMLGTNDLMIQNNRNAFDVAMGVGELVAIINNGGWQQRTGFATPKVLILSPSKVDDTKEGPNQKRFAGALQKTEALPGLLQQLAHSAGAYFFDVATIVPFGQAPDDIHFTAENHAAVAKAVAGEVQKIMGKKQ